MMWRSATLAGVRAIARREIEAAPRQPILTTTFPFRPAPDEATISSASGAVLG